MVLQFNIFQQVFLVAFSILYGVMLQSMSGLKPRNSKYVQFQPFPWQQALEDRIMRLRLLLSILVLNVGPFLYGICILFFLARFEYGFGEWQCWLLMFIVFWVALGVFGFQRFHGFLAIVTHKRKKELLNELYQVMKDQLKGQDPNWRPSLLSWVYYLTLPILLLSFACNPLCGGIVLGLIFVIFALWVIGYA